MDSEKPLFSCIGMNDGCSVVVQVRTLRHLTRLSRRGKSLTLPWVSFSTLIFTSELILCSTIYKLKVTLIQFSYHVFSALLTYEACTFQNMKWHLISLLLLVY